MKRLASLVLASGIALGTVLGLGRAASATPFSDVPANHWAYQYIQSLAADGIIDGYPDGKFKGDRPLTRYEMAVVVARVIAKLQENQQPGVTKQDLDKLQKLIDALKDELDALGVRVTNLEDALDALDKRTKFAQSLSMHGAFLPNGSFRQRYTIPTSIVNGTGASVTTYFGGTAAPGKPVTSGTTIDPFVNAFISTDDSNSFLTQNGSGAYIRQDTRFALAYAITDNLTVSLPVHVLNYEYGGEFTQNSKVDIEPSVDVGLKQTGAISNLHIKFGVIDDMVASRTGLAFRPPLPAVAYQDPLQPQQKGFAISGTISEGAFGLTDFRGSMTRLDETLIQTQPGATDPNVLFSGANTYFFPVQPPQGGFTQTTPAGAPKTDTFNSGSGTLAGVYLTSKAVNGSVYVSFYNGTTYNSAGAITGGPANPVPGFTYNDAYNEVVFTTPIPAGSIVRISYTPLGNTTNTNYQRYMINARLNQKFKGIDGLEIGLTFNRIYDFDDQQTSGPVSQTFQSSPQGFGLVSDTVLGVDFQAKIPYQISGAGSEPIVFGEAASSKFTADYRNVPATNDTAGVIGLRLKVQKIELSAQYQSIGVGFLDGAPFRYFGNAPALFAFYKGPYIPDFFGFANNLGINQQFDNSFTNAGLASPLTSVNPNLSYLYPIFNPFKGTGPEYFQAFTPNSRGVTATVNAPIRLGDVTFTTRAQYQHLEEIQPNAFGSLMYGPAFASNQREKYDTYTVGTQFYLPVFGQKLNANLSGTFETLKRNDQTPFTYFPFNPSTQTFDAASVLAATALPGGTSLVSYYPNYVNVHHLVLNAQASLPLTTNLALTGYYSTQRFGGEYGTTLGQNISEKKDFYSGGLVYSIPKTNSSISFTARNQSYIDNVVPAFNFQQNRQDLNFTVRF